MQTRTVEFAVGLFVLAGLLALAMLALKVGNMPMFGSGQYYSVTASFGNVGSLKEKAPVMLAGVRIGQVGHIGLNQQTFEAVVRLDISKKYDNLPVDTSASILTQGLLGEQFVSLDPGGSQRYLKNGDKIRVTQSAIMLDKIISQLLYSKAGH